MLTFISAEMLLQELITRPSEPSVLVEQQSDMKGTTTQMQGEI